MNSLQRFQSGSLRKSYVSLCRVRKGLLLSVRSTNSLIDVPSKPPSVTSVKNPWVEQKDPKGSSLTYYWNTETNETTHLGSPKPRNWIEVQDPKGSGLTYWWDPETQETTPLGVPKPHHLPTAQASNGNYFIHAPPQTLGQSMKTYFWWGAGITFAFAAVRAVIG